MLFILMYLVFHLTVGTLASRRQYARALHEANSQDVSAMVAQKKRKLKKMEHGEHCWRGPRHRSRSHDCDCHMSVNWRQLTDEIRRLEVSGIELPSPYPMVFFWPLLGYHAFLTGGKVKTDSTPALRPKEWEQKMERELLELES